MKTRLFSLLFAIVAGTSGLWAQVQDGDVSATLQSMDNQFTSPHSIENTDAIQDIFSKLKTTLKNQ